MHDRCRVGQSHVNNMKYEYKLKLSQRQNWLLKYENQIKTYEVKDIHMQYLFDNNRIISKSIAGVEYVCCPQT